MYEKLEKYMVIPIPGEGYEVHGQWKDDIHDLRTRILFDYRTYKIITAEVQATGIPFDICHQGVRSIDKLIDMQVGPSFNRFVKEEVMGANGCVHIGELVLGSVKAALQAASRQIPDWIDEDEYTSKWAVWEALYKNQCVYFAQPDEKMLKPEEIHEKLGK